MRNKQFWLWMALVVAVYLVITRTPRYNFVVQTDFVYRLDRFSGRIDRYVSDGTCITFRKHCIFEESPQ